MLLDTSPAALAAGSEAGIRYELHQGRAPVEKLLLAGGDGPSGGARLGRRMNHSLLKMNIFGNNNIISENSGNCAEDLATFLQISIYLFAFSEEFREIPTNFHQNRTEKR